MADEPFVARPLNGWKDIAAYLGKSVRSVQRWETTLGLPVHRIRTPDGHIVYADRGEIDRWRAALEPPPATIVSSSPAAAPAPAIEPTLRPSASAGPAGRPRRWARAAMAAAMLLVAFAAGVLWREARRPPAMPAGFRLADRLLQALDADGGVLWSYSFGRAVSEIAERRPRLQFPWIDVDGDGALEVLVFVRFAAPGHSAEISDGLYCFTSGGNLRWSVIPDQTFTFEGLRAAPPWIVHDFVVSDAPGPRRMWLALAHQTWWPGLVLEVDGAGRSTVRYVQAGRVRSLAHWRTAAGGMLAIGGTNERADASLVLIGDADPPSSHPGRVAGQYGCADCPPASPRHVFVFDRPELSAWFPRRHAAVIDLTVAGADLEVSLDQAVGATAGMDATAIIGPDADVKSLSLADAYWRTHERLADEGAIAHDAAACPERLERGIVREWTAARRWQAHHVGAASAEQRLAGAADSP